MPATGTTTWPNHMKMWSGRDYLTIIETLKQGRSWADAAEAIGRKPHAARQRADFLVHDDDDLTSTEESAQLRRTSRQAWKRLQARLLAEPDYDWESVARSKHAAAGIAYWDKLAENRLWQVWKEAAASQRAWLEGRPAGARSDAMRQLVVELSIHESDIADRAIELGLANSHADVADRLGALPGGALEARARLARADTGQALHILTLTDAAGTLRHSSLHPSRDDAERACEMVLLRKGIRRYVVRAQITCRYIGRMAATTANSDDDIIA